jgi:putative nucleotidyltransferase with HDIG domain
MDSQTLEDLKKKIIKLPPLSTVVTRLLALNPDHDDFFESVLALAKEDPTFTLRIIKLSNSAINTPVEEIVGIREAIVRIGTTQIAGLITSMAMTEVFIPSNQREKDLWKHAIQVAVIARVLACATTAFTVNPEQAYLCGLIHDLGKYVLPYNQLNNPNGNAGILNCTSTTAGQYIHAEKDASGFNHAILGMLICKKWKLPEILCNVVRHHHQEELPKSIENDVKCANLIRITQLADMVSVYFTLHSEVLNFELEQIEECLQENCVDQFPGKSPVSANELAALIAPMWLEANMAIKNLKASA